MNEVVTGSAAAPTDAGLLFAQWRTPLLKDDTPGSGLVITDGQEAVHWQRDEGGRLCIDLESM